MDIYDHVGARAAVYLMEHPEVNRCISWATTVYQYAALAIEKVDFPFGSEIDILPDPGREALDNLRETLEILNGPPGPVSHQEASVYIGGPEVEAEIAEIKKLQAEHETAEQELKNQFEDQQREQSAADETIQKDYFERHPDQAHDERVGIEQKFEHAKQQNREGLSAKQQAQMAELLREQQEQLQQLQRGQQVRQEFQQNKDDIFR